MSKPKRVIKTMTLTFLLAIMFVVGWVFGVLGSRAVGFGPVLSRVFQFLFIAIVGFHGLFIFLVQPVRSKDARNVWIKWFYYLTCHPHLYHQRGKIPGKSLSSRSAQQSSSTVRDSDPPGGASATLAKSNLGFNRGVGVMSSIARRFGYRASHSGEVHANDNTHAENPTDPQGTYTKSNPTTAGLQEVEERGSNETLSTTYSSFAPNMTTQSPLVDSEDGLELQPRHSGSVLHSPSRSPSTQSFRPHPSMVNSDERPGLPPRSSSLSTSYGIRPHHAPELLPQAPELPRRSGGVLQSQSLSPSYLSTRGFRPHPFNEEPPELPPRRLGSFLQTSPSQSTLYSPRVHISFSGDKPPELPPPRSGSTVKPSPSHSTYSLSSLRSATVDGIRPDLPPPRKPNGSDMSHPSRVHGVRPDLTPARKTLKQSSTPPTYSKCIPRSARVGSRVRPEPRPPQPRKSKRAHLLVPAVVVDDELRPGVPLTHSSKSAGVLNGEERPKAAPRTGKAARPLPALPDSIHVFENQHTEESV